MRCRLLSELGGSSSFAAYSNTSSQVKGDNDTGISGNLILAWGGERRTPLGFQPFAATDPLPMMVMAADEVHLVCWMTVDTEGRFEWSLTAMWQVDPAEGWSRALDLLLSSVGAVRGGYLSHQTLH